MSALRIGLVPALALALSFGISAAYAQTAAPPAPASDARLIQLAPIVVVGTTPLLGIGTPLEKVPANVQTIKGSAICGADGCLRERLCSA